MIKKIILGTLVMLVSISGLQANPLVITEVMPSNLDSDHYPDWWELTNLGTNNIDLSAYSWRDNSAPGFIGATNAPFVGVIIHAHESIIFCETISGGFATATEFRTWWNISPGVQVIMVGRNPGLSSGGDQVRLWSTNAAALGSNTNGLDLFNAPEYLVDQVDLPAATTGHSFYYNTNNGLFSATSTVGVSGAFQAVTTTDVGSPGVAPTNTAPIVIVNQPANQLVNVGSTAVFSIVAYGLPKPQFQWLFNGVPVDPNIAKAVFAVSNNYCRGTLTLTNVQVNNGGTFRLVVTNDYQSVVSSNATLTVNTAPFAPIFTLLPVTNLYAYPGQTVTLTAAAFGNPPPTFQWQFNGANIDGQTDSQYVFGLSDTNQSGIYTVVAANSSGNTNASAILMVTPKPNLRITEIQSTEATNAAGSNASHNDWWELSNLGDFPVNLKGYRFDDDSFSLAAAYTITNDLTIAPGESIVFVEDMTPDAFRTWWGAQNLRPNLQIIPYHGSALSFSGTSGDILTVWNAAAANEYDFIDSASVAPNPEGVTFGFDPYARIFFGITPDGYSVEGINGGFASAFDSVTPEIGSPGTILNVPHFTSVTKTNGGFALAWFTQPSWTNTIQFKNNLAETNWTTLTNILGDATTTMNFIDSTTSTQRFYRINLKP
ncbi:MAG: immunoglobulin domain-containing protein [Limisphaerales bacterium]